MGIAYEVSAGGLGVTGFNFLLGKDVYWGAYSRFYNAFPRSEGECNAAIFVKGRAP